MNYIIYLTIILFILLIIIILVINNTKKYMSNNSVNMMGVDGKIVMDTNYEPSSNELITLKNVLNINKNKGIYALYKPNFKQEPIQNGDIVNFGNTMTVIRESNIKTLVTYDSNDKKIIMTNDSDFDIYIKITYSPPILDGTDALCRFNIYINNKAVVGITTPVVRTGTLVTTTSDSTIVTYFMILKSKSTNTLDIRITELQGSDQHLGYEGYIILEEL